MFSGGGSFLFYSLLLLLFVYFRLGFFFFFYFGFVLFNLEKKSKVLWDVSGADDELQAGACSVGLSRGSSSEQIWPEVA